MECDKSVNQAKEYNLYYHYFYHFSSKRRELMLGYIIIYSHLISTKMNESEGIFKNSQRMKSCQIFFKNKKKNDL